MPSYSGVWSLPAVMQAVGAGNWTNFLQGKIGLFGGGSTGTYTNVISYISIATTGNATDFGDLTAARAYISSCASAVRGIFAGGIVVSTRSNIIDYVTIATTGNAIDFGDLTVARNGVSAFSSLHGGLAA